MRRYIQEKDRRTVSIEVGMQNSALGVVLATAHFADPLVAAGPGGNPGASVYAWKRLSISHESHAENTVPPFFESRFLVLTQCHI